MLKYLRLLLCTLIIIISFSCPSCVQITPITHTITQKIIIPTNVDGPLKFPVDFYITTTFNKNQYWIIDQSIDYWKDVTSGIVQTNLIKNWEPPQKFSDDFYRHYPYKTVWLLNKDSNIVQEMFKEHGGFKGISYGNYIIIVDEPGSDILSPFQLFVVFTHEFGHQLGLQHIKGKYKALMNTTCNGGSITKWDMIQFCSLYNCNNSFIPLLQIPDIIP